MSRYGLKKSHRKILKNFGRKNILNFSPKIIFENFENHEVILYEKKISFFLSYKITSGFSKNSKIFLEKISKNFFNQKCSIFFDEIFLNHIYSSWRIRKTRFQLIPISLKMFFRHVEKKWRFFCSYGKIHWKSAPHLVTCSDIYSSKRTRKTRFHSNPSNLNNDSGKFDYPCVFL